MCSSVETPPPLLHSCYASLSPSTWLWHRVNSPPDSELIRWTRCSCLPRTWATNSSFLLFSWLHLHNNKTEKTIKTHPFLCLFFVEKILFPSLLPSFSGWVESIVSKWVLSDKERKPCLFHWNNVCESSFIPTYFSTNKRGMSLKYYGSVNRDQFQFQFHLLLHSKVKSFAHTSSTLMEVKCLIIFQRTFAWFGRLFLDGV